MGVALDVAYIKKWLVRPRKMQTVDGIEATVINLIHIFKSYIYGFSLGGLPGGLLMRWDKGGGGGRWKGLCGSFRGVGWM